MDRTDSHSQTRIFSTRPEAIREQHRTALSRIIPAVLVGLALVIPMMLREGDVGPMLFAIGFLAVIVMASTVVMRRTTRSQALTALELDGQSVAWLSGAQVRNRVWKNEIAGISENERQIEIAVTGRPDGIWIPRAMFSTQDYDAIRDHVSQWSTISEGTENRSTRKGLYGRLAMIACFATIYIAQNPWLVGIAGAIAVIYLGRSFRLLRQMKTRIPLARASIILAIFIFVMMSLLKVRLLTVGPENFWDFLPAAT